MALWDNLGTSGNVEDRRGMGGVGLGGGLFGIVLFWRSSYMGVQIDPAVLEQIAGGVSGTSQTTEQPSEFQGKDSYETFVSTVLGSTNAYWKKLCYKKINRSPSRVWCCFVTRRSRAAVWRQHRLDHTIARLIRQFTWMKHFRRARTTRRQQR